jgi:Ger(x)C family germination protein
MLMLPGCQVQELNQSVVVSGLGVELEEDQLRISMQMARPALPGQGSSAGESSFEVVSETGRSLTEGLRKIILLFPRSPLLSQANLLVLGENLAQTDLAWIADAVLRNPDIRKNATVVIARGSTPEEILNTEVLMESLSAAAIPRMLENQESQLGIYQEVNLDKLLNNLARSGIEAVVPAISLFESNNGQAIRLDGTAVFKGRKMVGYLNPDQSRGLRYLTPGRTQGGLINIPAPFAGEGRVGIEIIRSQTRVEPVNVDGQIVMRINYSGEGNYYEQTSAQDILRLKNIPVLEGMIGDEIEKDMMACIQQAQKLGSDILGWGAMVNARDHALWQEIESDWEDIFPEVKTEIKVDFQLRRTYLTDRSLVYQ